MNKPTLLYINQYGIRVFAKTLRELQSQAGGGRISKQYNDDKLGNTRHTGYIIGKYWFTAYKPYHFGE